MKRVTILQKCVGEEEDQIRIVCKLLFINDLACQRRTIAELSRIKSKKLRENYLKTKISHRTFGGCESDSQIGSDRKLRKSQISISKQMYHTVTLLMEIINISSLDFYFGESTRTFISPRTRVEKPSAAPRGLKAFRHHLN